MAEYTVVIRTLGTAGEKYQRLLSSLVAQTIKPSEIIVYIAEGYSIPKETVGVEQYVYVKKGMVAQRALPYTEVATEWMLMLDDDVYLPPHSVETLFKELKQNDADVISPDVFHNASRGFAAELMMSISGRMRARRGNDRWGYRVMRTAGYSYNKTPKGALLSQTNAGPCVLCRKSDFLNIHFEDELWLDDVAYALGDDQVMCYKMYLTGLKQLTSYDSGIEHLDAGGNLTKEKEQMLIHNDFRFKTIFWHRFIWTPERNWLKRAWGAICIGYTFGFGIAISAVKCQFGIAKLKWNAIGGAISFIRSDRYRSLPRITDCRTN
ncbi:MAG: glycosyl transferase family 2 [Muribaculaceae bacterium]